MVESPIKVKETFNVSMYVACFIDFFLLTDMYIPIHVTQFDNQRLVYPKKQISSKPFELNWSEIE